jgi:hypothetical protein
LGAAPRQAPGVLIRDLVRQVVLETAPEETVVVEGLLQYSDAQVLTRLRRRWKQRDPLGFGVDEVAVLVTPVVWLALDKARDRLADTVVDGAARGSRSLWRRIRHRHPQPAVIPPLTPDQQRMVRQVVLDAAAEAGLSGHRSGQIANGVVARLALAEAGPADAGAAGGTP